MATRFILSLDCEGKWGVADCLTRKEHAWLSDTKLQRAYRQIVDLLDEYDVPATFAFVGLFAEPEDSFRRLTPAIRDLADQAPDYLEPALADSSEGSRQGWHGAWAIDTVGNAKARHEIALHGVTHVPWTTQDRDFFSEELALFGELTSPAREAKTFVFPRNDVAHLDLLSRAGLEGYRMAQPRRSRPVRLLSEFNLWASPERISRDRHSQIVPIPAGFFINWRHGPRRLVPRGVSRERFRRLLDRAGSEHVVHAWMHPENVSSAPDTLNLLRDLVEIVARNRDSGDCEPMTQIDYVRSLSS